MASYVDIEIDKGVSKNVFFEWFDTSTNLPMDLTGFSVDMQVRRSYGSPDLLLELSTANNKIDLTGGPGTMVLLFSPADTTAMTDYSCVYEIVITRPDNTKISFLKGKFTILQNVVGG